MNRPTWILLLCGVGLLLALYAVSLHYDSSGSSICNITETFNCDKVNKSPWSVFLGLPVAVWGALAYLFVLLIVWQRRRIAKTLAFERRDLWQYLLLFVVLMTTFQLYLTFLEIFVIKAYCIVCLLNQAVTIGLLLVVGKHYLASR